MIVDPSTLGERNMSRSLPRRVLAACSSVVGGLWRNLRNHRIAIGMVLGIWCFAYARVFFDPIPHSPLLFNWTPSIPYRLAMVEYGDVGSLHRGDFVIYAFDGPAQRFYPGLHRQPFFKQIAGLPGDTITVKEREVFVNGVSKGLAKPHTFDGRPLEPIAESVIAPGYYYVQGTHIDSFDSRYRESGLVRADQVIGKVIPLF